MDEKVSGVKLKMRLRRAVGRIRSQAHPKTCLVDDVGDPVLVRTKVTKGRKCRRSQHFIMPLET